jgi:multidrug efflux system outer membrane protein
MTKTSTPSVTPPGARTRTWPLLLGALIAGLAGCNLAPEHRTPPLPVPAALTGNGEALGAPALEAEQAGLDMARALRWVRSAQLRDVLALALTHNRDLRVAIENIERARAQYGITSAGQWPTINAQLQGSRQRSAAELSNSGQSSISQQITAQLAFTSYELDLWGRVRNLNEAALQQFLQSEENRRSVQIGLIADVANAWLTLGADLARLQLARETLASREKSLALTREMHRLGATSGLTLAQSEAAVETARGDVAAFTAQVQADRNALALLVGGPVPERLLPTARTLAGNEGDDVATALQDLPDPLPSTVLLQRPDIRAAEHNLRAMAANIGAARAALFPSISLTTSIGTGSRELDGLFATGNDTWSIVPLLRLPLFDGGSGQAGVRVAEANQRIALAQYEKAVQTAFREVADGLAARAQWSERLAAQARMVEASRKALALSEARFRAGVDNYLSVLDAQRSLYTAQQTLISLRLAEQQNRVTLWKVLGGADAPDSP